MQRLSVCFWGPSGSATTVQHLDTSLLSPLHIYTLCHPFIRHRWGLCDFRWSEHKWSAGSCNKTRELWTTWTRTKRVCTLYSIFHSHSRLLPKVCVRVFVVSFVWIETNHKKFCSHFPSRWHSVFSHKKNRNNLFMARLNQHGLKISTFFLFDKASFNSLFEGVWWCVTEWKTSASIVCFLRYFIDHLFYLVEIEDFMDCLVDYSRLSLVI